MPHLIALGTVVAAVLLAYAGAPTPALVVDGQLLITDNPLVHEMTAANVAYIFTHDYWQPHTTSGVYRPLTTLSFLVDYAVLGHGARATGYIVENVALHCICAVLVYVLVWQLAGRVWPATAAALLFGVHPVTTEAVTNVVGRADLLATAGVLAGILCWAHARHASGLRRIAILVALAVSAAIGLLGKETGVVLVGLAVLYDVAFPPVRRVRAEHVVLGAVTIAYLAARWYVERIGLPREGVLPLDNPIVEAPFLLGRLTAIGVLVRELGLLVWPATLSIDYSFRQIPIVSWPPASPWDWVSVAGLVMLVAALVGLVRLRRREPRVFFLLTLAALALVPSANLLLTIGTIMAERFLYLPLAGIAGAVALAADGWARTPRRRMVATALLASVVAAAVVRTSVRNLDWRDERTLWAATVQAVPDSAKAHKAYAAALWDPTADAQAVAGMIWHAERAVQLRPDYMQALSDLGNYYMKMGDVVAAEQSEAARTWYEKAAGVLESARRLDERAATRFVEQMKERGHAEAAIPDKGNGIVYANLSLAYLRLRDFPRALEATERWRRLAPTNVALYRDIGAIDIALGRTDDAAVAFWQAVVLSEDAAATEQLVAIYRAMPAGDAPIVTYGEGGEPQLHVGHPAVSAHRCRALRELVAIFSRAKLSELADGARAELAECDGD
jgi:tetratricopeptide (TPR) repeat protein